MVGVFNDDHDNESGEPNRLANQQHDYHQRRNQTLMAGLLWAIIVILVVFWLLGFLLHFGGGLIHILIVIAVILLIYNLVTGRGARL